MLGLEDKPQAQAVVDDIFAAEAKVFELEDGFIERLDAMLAKWGRSSFISETLDVLHSIQVRHYVMQTV